MRSNNEFVIHITAVDEKPDRFVASLHSEFLDATYAVEFSAGVTGAVALHRFAAMIEHQYRKPIELCIDGPFPILSNPVKDMLRSIKRLEPVAR